MCRGPRSHWVISSSRFWAWFVGRLSCFQNHLTADLSGGHREVCLPHTPYQACMAIKMTASTKRCEIIWTIYYSVFSPVASEEARERARPREYNSEVVGRGERARKEHRRGRYRARRLPFDSSLQQPRRRSPDRRLQFVDLLHGELPLPTLHPCSLSPFLR